MAKKSTGIYKRGKTFWITYTGIDGKQQWESSRSKLKADAEYLLACRKKEIAEGLIPVTSHRKKFATTFDELAVRYLEFCQPQRDIKTKSCRVATLCQAFGPVKLVAITLEDLEKYQSRRQTETRPPRKEGDSPLLPVKPVTVNKELATLKHMFTKADQWGLIPPSALDTVRKLKLAKVDNSRLRFLSVGESRGLVVTCGRGLREIVTFALNTGCRRGEIFSLTWDHVDLKHGFIRICETKNGEPRDIPLNSTLLNMLAALSACRESPYVFVDPDTGKRFQETEQGTREAKECALNAGCQPQELFGLTWKQVDFQRGTIRIASGKMQTIRISGAIAGLLELMQSCRQSPFVFVNPETGTRYQDVKKSFATACCKAGIMDFTFHDLRHTFASQLVMSGVDLTTVSRLMGHKSLAMTLRYSHLAPDHLRRAVDVLAWPEEAKAASG